MKKHIIDGIIYFVIGMAIWFISFVTLKPYEQELLQESMRYYSDCCIIPGIILICLYVLTFIGRKGFYDGLTYSFRFVGQTLVPFLMKSPEKQSYYDYKVSKAEKRKEPIFAGLIVGILFLVAAIVFYIIYKCI